jgi:hypothetical protein
MRQYKPDERLITLFRFHSLTTRLTFSRATPAIAARSLWLILGEFRAADETQLAISDREHRHRPRLSVEDGKLADDCAGAEHGQDTLFAPRRGYNDLEQALLEAITTVSLALR